VQRDNRSETNASKMGFVTTVVSIAVTLIPPSFGYSYDGHFVKTQITVSYFYIKSNTKWILQNSLSGVLTDTKQPYAHNTVYPCINA